MLVADLPLAHGRVRCSSVSANRPRCPARLPIRRRRCWPADSSRNRRRKTSACCDWSPPACAPRQRHPLLHHARAQIGIDQARRHLRHRLAQQRVGQFRLAHPAAEWRVLKARRIAELYRLVYYFFKPTRRRSGQCSACSLRRWTTIWCCSVRVKRWRSGTLPHVAVSSAPTFAAGAGDSGITMKIQRQAFDLHGLVRPMIERWSHANEIGALLRELPRYRHCGRRADRKAGARASERRATGADFCWRVGLLVGAAIAILNKQCQVQT